MKKSYGLRLRTRGGLSVRKRWTRVVSEMRRPHKCPSCASLRVKRVSVGIWGCGRCGYRFSGGAYQPSTRLGQTAMRSG